MVRPLLNVASPGGAQARLSVLVFHRVLPAPDPLYPEAMHAQRFTELCRWVQSMFCTLPLDDAARRLRNGTLPRRALAITFDDGYADNLHVAMPILQSQGLPATFFIATGFLDGGCMWNDRVIESLRRSTLPSIDLRELLGPDTPVFALASTLQRRIALEAVIARIKYLPVARREALVQEIHRRSGAHLPADLMLTSAQVRQMRHGGMQIGAHTVSHPILATLTADAARQEMADSKHHLERLLGEPVTLFAYPNGQPGEDYNADSVAIARALGFEAAVTTARGAANGRTDCMQIPRFTPWDRSRLRFGARMLSTLWSSRRGSAQLASTPG